MIATESELRDCLHQLIGILGRIGRQQQAVNNAFRNDAAKEAAFTIHSDGTVKLFTYPDGAYHWTAAKAAQQLHPVLVEYHAEHAHHLAP